MSTVRSPAPIMKSLQIGVRISPSPAPHTPNVSRLPTNSLTTYDNSAL